MDATTSGRFRVLASPPDRAELLLIEVGGVDADDRESGNDDSDGDGGRTGRDDGRRDDGQRDDGGGRSGEGNWNGADDRNGAGSTFGGEATFDPVYVETAGYDDALIDDVAALRPGDLVEATLGWTDGTARFLSLSVVRRTRFEFVDGVTGVFEAARDTWREAATAGEAMNSRVTRGTDGEPNGVLYTFAKQEGARDLFEEFRNGLLPLEPLLARANAALDAGPRDVFVMRPADEPFVLVYIVFDRDGLLARTIRETYDVRPERA